MKTKRFFPMFVDLSDKKIVVVGGGNIATRRVKTLLQFTRNITAVAPKTTMELHELGKAGYVNLINRPVKRSDFDMAYMVIAATNDWKLNDEIHRVCKEEGIYVNVADDKSKCDFYFPGVYMKDEVVVGITASGLNHKKARKVRVAIQEAMEESTENEKDRNRDRKQRKPAGSIAEPDGTEIYSGCSSGASGRNPHHENHR